MPLFNLKWTRENPPNEEGTPQDPIIVSTQYRGSTAEKAVSNIIRDGHLSEYEIAGFDTHDWEELDEDGEVVASDSISLRK